MLGQTSAQSPPQRDVGSEGAPRGLALGASAHQHAGLPTRGGWWDPWRFPIWGPKEDGKDIDPDLNFQGVREQVAEVRISLSLLRTTATGVREDSSRSGSQVSKSKKGHVVRKHAFCIKEGELHVL